MTALVGTGGTTDAGTAAAIRTIATMFERRTGQLLGQQRMWRVESALSPMLRDLDMKSLAQLSVRLNAAGEEPLVQRVVDALINHETSFFRDAPVFTMVADAAVALHAAAPDRRLRIWSAGCSTGQEPLSLAMMLDERGLPDTAYDIIATDVSADAVARARQGSFTQFEIQRGLPMMRMITWFDGDDRSWTAKRELVGRIQFRTHNLVFDAPPPGHFDVILCRNVLLYFAQDVRRQVFSMFADALRPSGLLVLGAGETVIGQTDRFDPSTQWRGAYTRVD
ncbi:CheR family methyltransferase [Sphingomonas floccifaciens]|uniref:CheR family methyltransferase n=1 Tax=Sphingomonas floccifaciens TaxID=1844115 RepID=A0ABW4NFK3_9SPHN